MNNWNQENRIRLGVCYYPEHWDQSSWADDLDRMLAAGLETVRIAEFAWSYFEPRQGEYTYAFFDDFLALAHSKGMKVIFCTPTATPPAWLTRQYPEVLNADMDGHPIYHGARRHYNYNSPVYRRLCAALIEKIAAHYGQHPAIIGWQLDNEFNCENDVFYSDSDTTAFRAYLQNKYGTLESLNQSWGTVFWNQTYTDWEEVHLPRRTNNGAVNPHQKLDYYRFISESVCSFAHMQAEIIRKYKKPQDFITHNGMFDNIDYQKLTRESLDVLMYDSYPNFAYCLDDYDETNRMKDRKWSRNLAEVRAVSPNFGIMEQQSGANGWNTRLEAPTPRPGQMTLWTMQSIAHGADYISYFRWRTATFGTEMYWHGILDYSGRDNRRLHEVAQIAQKTAALREVAGSRYCAKFGIVKDYDNIWDAQLDNWHRRVDEVSLKSLFMAAQLMHAPFDFVYMDKPLAVQELLQYDVLFYPHAVILKKETMQLLQDYAEAGGKLVMGCRTGYKNETGKCVTDHLPGLAAQVTGVDIPEYTFVAPDMGKMRFNWGEDHAEAAVFNDILLPVGTNAEVLGSYTDGYYAGQPALIRNRFGKGETYYFGGAFALDTAMLFLRKLGLSTPWQHVVELPESCEIAVREKNGTQYLFVLNYSAQPAAIFLKETLTDLLTGKRAAGQLELPAYGVMVFRRNGQ